MTLPDIGDLDLVSLYLRDGAGMSAENCELLAGVGCLLSDRQTVIGGDFQVSPQQLAASGMLELLHAEVVFAAEADEAGAGTCRSSVGDWTTLDYFLVSWSLMSRVRACEILLKCGSDS